MDYHAGMSIVRVVIGFFEIGPSIVNRKTGPHTFYHSVLHDIEDWRVGGCCRRALCHSGGQT